jgi:ABC-type transport system involved in resistance to organic solvents, auxiliary component
MQFVEQKILPNVDFQKITQSAVGRYWREATPAQRTALEQQFKQLLVYTYAGAVKQIKDQKVKLLPYREPANAQDVTVRTRVINNGEPLQLDYRLENTPAAGRSPMSTSWASGWSTTIAACSPRRSGKKASMA